MIQSLQLINFRSCRTVGLNFPAPRTLIVGANDAGKSTVADAIAWCLTGRCRGLDQGGRGVRDLVRQGAREMWVSVTLNGIGQVTRAFDGKGVSLSLLAPDGELVAGALGDVQAGLLARLGGVRLDAIEVACHATAFLDSDHAAARDLLLLALNVRVDLDGEDFRAVQQLGLVGSVNGPATRIGDLTLDTVETLEERARDKRLDLKRRIQEIGAPQPPPLPAALRETPPLDTLQARLDEKKTNAAQRFAGMHQRLGERATLADRERALRDEIAKIDARLRAASDVGVRLAHAEAERDTLKRAIDATQDTQAAGAARAVDIAALSRVIGAIDQHSPSKGCVIDPTIPCKTPAKAFADRKPVLLKKRADIEREGKAAATAMQKRAADAKRLQEFDVEVARLRRAREDVVRDACAAEEKGAELTAVQTRLAALGEAADEQAFNGARDAIRGIEHLIDLWKRHQAALEAHTDCVRRAKDLREQLALAERACEALGPKGARAAALEAALAGFIAETGSFLQAWGVTLAIEPEPWKVLMNGRPAALMSKSGRLRAGVALQLAVVRHAGLGFAIVDEADILDEENARTFSRLIASARIGRDGDEGSIIVLATRGKNYALPRVMGLSAVRLALDARAETQVVEATGAPDTTSVGVVATTASQ